LLTDTRRMGACRALPIVQMVFLLYRLEPFFLLMVFV
jgi:hypothetical protein